MNVPYTVIIGNKAQKDFLKLLLLYNKTVKKAIDGLEKKPQP